MKIDILTLFPKMFLGPMNESILKKAKTKGLVEINIHNLRDFAKDKHRTCDDKPFGGGPGMVMKPEPIFEAVDYIESSAEAKTMTDERRSFKRRRAKIILLSPQGRRLTQSLAERLSKYKHLILICGHYEGVDERVRLYLAQDEISIGDYILTGGELATMVLIDCVVRLIPGVLGNERSAITESFRDGLLDYPQYSRPAVFRGMKVPSELLSGDHDAIRRWRAKEALKRTQKRRPDLLKK